MRHGFRCVASVLVLALLLPAAAGALPAAGAGFGSSGWNPWRSIVSLVAGLFGAKPMPEVETGCGIDGSGLPKCDS